VVSGELATVNGLILSTAPLPSNLPQRRHQSVSSGEHAQRITAYCLLDLRGSKETKPPDPGSDTSTRLDNNFLIGKF
jgi:hypothetical protein